MSAAVFISYASQDDGAAMRICESLRAAGIEVWFDLNELRGGDAWDSKIRQQIKECALFVPVISAQTQARAEGFFRLEWHLAEQRTYLMAHDKPFLLPVVIDETADPEARVPERFRERQWMRLPGGECSPAFTERVKTLLDGLATGPIARGPATGNYEPMPRARPWLIPLFVGAAACAGAIWFYATQKSPPNISVPPVVHVPLSEARQLVEKANAIVNRPGEKNTEMLNAAEELYSRALTLESSDAETWAAAAKLDAQTVFLRIDVSETRRNRAKQRVARAAALAPDAPFIRRAQAAVYAFADGTPAMMEAAEIIYRELLERNKGDRLLIAEFGLALRQQRKFAEAAEIIEKAGLIEDAGWNYCRAARYDEANRIADQLLATQRTVGAIYLKIDVQAFGFEDPVATTAAVNLFTPEELLSEGPAANAAINALWNRDPDRALVVLKAYPQEFLYSFIYGGPKRYLTGLAHERANRPAAAQTEWRIALDQVRKRLETKSNEPVMLGMAALLLACLGDRAAAEPALELYRSIAGLGPKSPPDEKESLTLMRLGRKEEVARKVLFVLAGKFPDYEILHAYVRQNPDYDALRGDPRVEKLLRDSLPRFAKPFEPETPKDPATKPSGS